MSDACLEGKGTIRASGNSTRALVAENMALLLEMLDQLRGLTDSQYALNCNEFGGDQSIGRHCRHIYDHYQAFFRAWDGAQSTETVKINYDQRERCAAIETRVTTAVSQIEACVSRVEAFTDEQGDRLVNLSVLVNAGAEELLPMVTTTDRELTFLASHTTHHAAIIAMLMHTLDIAPDPKFGRATSTRSYDAQRR